MRKIRHTETLFYCDGPQVIEAGDDGGNVFVGVAIPSGDVFRRFLLKSVTSERLASFREGNIDLRSLILGSGAEEWILGTMSGCSAVIHNLIVRNGPLESTGFLPDAGFFLQTA